MADEPEVQEPEEEVVEEDETDLVESIYKELFGDEDEPSEEVKEATEVAEEKYEKVAITEDAKLKKMATMFAQHVAEEKAMKAYNDAIAKMDDLERDIAVAILKPGDDPSVIAKKVGVVAAQAQRIREIESERLSAAEKAAEAEAIKAWGLPSGMKVPKSEVEEEELVKKVESGDTRAAFTAIIGDDLPPF